MNSMHESESKGTDRTIKLYIEHSLTFDTHVSPNPFLYLIVCSKVSIKIDVKSISN